LVSGNCVHLWKFLTVGRGHYREAADYLVANTVGSVITLSSDHEARTKMVLSYYFEHAAMHGKTPQYVSYDSPVAPQWLLVQSQEVNPTPGKMVGGPWAGSAFVLEETFPYHGLSGWHWFLYHRIR